ncbi:glycosyltransferase [bacterium]|nr:glycosyltransferase [bacterium]
MKALIFKSLLLFTNQKTPIKHSKNIVSPYDGFIDKKYLKNTVNYFYVAIPYDNLKEKFDFNIQDKYQKKFLYLGRIEQRQKNILYLIKNFNNIDFYGAVDDENIKNQLGDKYKGIAKREDIQKIFAKYSFLIISSFSEGFTIVISEAFANATPVICSNKIKSKDFFLNNKENGYELDINKTPIELINKIHNLSFDEYNKMCHSVFEFAEKYLTIEEFNKK